MGKDNLKTFEPEKIMLGLERDVTFIKGVALNHKNWNEAAARTVANLIGWPSTNRVFKIGVKAKKENKSSSKDWQVT